MVAECCEALDGYSRWALRNSESLDSLAAVAYLPEELLISRAPREFALLQGKLGKRLGEQTLAICAAEEVFAQWLADDQRVSAAESAEAVQVLRKAGFGIEPDPRRGQKVVAGNCDPLPPGKDFQVATALPLLLTLVAVTCFAEGDIPTGGRALRPPLGAPACSR
jgi:hypothetical protein